MDLRMVKYHCTISGVPLIQRLHKIEQKFILTLFIFVNCILDGLYVQDVLIATPFVNKILLFTLSLLHICLCLWVLNSFLSSKMLIFFFFISNLFFRLKRNIKDFKNLIDLCTITQGLRTMSSAIRYGSKYFCNIIFQLY